MKPYEKEGQVKGTAGATIQLILGVGLAVLVLIFMGVLAGQTFVLTEDQTTLLATVAGESFTPVNSTVVSLANDEVISGSLELYNATDTFNLNMFTIDYPNGDITLTNNTLNNTAMLANYTHGPQAIEDSIKGSIVSAFTAFEQTGDYLPLIVLAVIIFFILVLVLGFTTLPGMTGKGGRSGTVL